MTLDGDSICTVSELNETIKANQNPEFDAIVRSILVSRAQCGATIQEIRDDYYEIVGEQFPYVKNPTEYLLQLPNVLCRTNENGTRLFYLTASEKSQHILSMVQQQKPPRQQQLQMKRHNIAPLYPELRRITTSNWNINDRIPINDELNNNVYYHGVNDDDIQSRDNCYFKDNYQYLKKFGMGSCDTLYSRSRTISNNSDSSAGGYRYNNYGSRQNLNMFTNYSSSAHIYDYQLMGDDFFLSMATMELNCRYNKVDGILSSGLCSSGQTINDVNYLIQTTEKLHKRIILNIGSVDILQGHHLIDLQNDFIQLLDSFDARGVQPILTTLAPLANLGHRPETKRILERFNEFLRSLGLPCIDIWKALTNTNGQTLYDCYQSGARKVSGSHHPHVFWNKIGRQRVLNMIKSSLEYSPIL